jgi:hypothetical protein
MTDTCLSPSDWKELNEMLWEGSLDDDTGKHRPYTAFRGLPEMHNLRSGIQRIRLRSKVSPPLPVIERRLIDTFKQYSQEHYPAMQTDWQILSLRRHYQLMSPHVALFFATENTDKWDKDGVIWCASRKRSRELLPADLREILVKRNTYVFSVEVLQQTFRGLEDLDNSPEKVMIWFEPPSISQRIVNQYALFSVMPGVETSHTDYFEANPRLRRLIRIPKGLKPEIRDRLQVMNLSHRTIYPGLEGIALWLKAYYS